MSCVLRFVVTPFTQIDWRSRFRFWLVFPDRGSPLLVVGNRRFPAPKQRNGWGRSVKGGCSWQCHDHVTIPIDPLVVNLANRNVTSNFKIPMVLHLKSFNWYFDGDVFALKMATFKIAAIVCTQTIVCPIVKSCQVQFVFYLLGSWVVVFQIRLTCRFFR